MPYKDKEVKRQYNKKYRIKNSEKLNNWSRNRYAEDSTRFKSAIMKYKYSITYEDYLLLLEKQGGVCDICGTDDPRGRGKFHIDHDHSCCSTEKTCGKCIRSLLCSSCNRKLGILENSEWLDKAFVYLQKWDKKLDTTTALAERSSSITDEDIIDENRS